MVQIKRKVTIKKKVAQEEIPVEKPIVTPNSEPTPTTEPTSAPKEPQSGSSMGKWILGAIVALGVCCGAYFLINGGNSTEGTPYDNTETISDQSGNTSATDSLAEETKAAEEETAAEETTTQEETDAAEQTPKQEAPKAQDAPIVTEKPAIVEQPATKAPSANVSSSTEENAKRVIRGEFGNGQTRKDKLGDKYTEIQNRVNEMYRNGLVQ